MEFFTFTLILWMFTEVIMKNLTNITVAAFETKEGKVFISAEDQQREIDRYHIDCLTQILYGERHNTAAGRLRYGLVEKKQKEENNPNLTLFSCPMQTSVSPAFIPHTLYCNRTWDDIACWPDTEPGSVAAQPCPNYIHGFLVGSFLFMGVIQTLQKASPYEATSNFATKRCMPDGHWYVHPIHNTTWTNYSECYDLASEQPTPRVSQLIEVHMSNIRLMYNIGYSVSLISLTLAVFVMTLFKRLHCPRNTVHVNLFVSFILRATLSILKETLLVQGLGLQKDVEKTPYDDTVLFIEEGAHWECKLLFTIFYYVLSASYMWIFVEGLHLHTLIMVSVFSERSSIKYYICLGWGSPFLFIIPWVVVRITKENVLCWNTNPTPEYFWIINGPVVLSIAINFLLFLNILRALLTKIKIPSSRSAKKYKYRRLAKATMVLIPLFGVHYIVSMGIPYKVDPKTEVIKLYYEMFFNSFQGLFVAVLFCFLNGEVQMEILKRLCGKGPYYHYRRYYRTSFGHSSSKCTCHCHKHLTDSNACLRNSHSDNDEPSRRYSEGANAHLTSDKNSRYAKICVCRWRIDSNGHISRYVKRTVTNKYSPQVIHRADSCL